jgi:lauroyl/myristoyl acyltransferase
MTAPAATPAISPAKKRPAGPLTLSRKPSADPMLENLYTLFRRSYLAARTRGKGNEAYQGIGRSWSAMCAEPWVQGTLFQNEGKLVAQFARETGIQAKDLIHRSLAANGWTRIFGVVLEQVEKREFAGVATVTGKQHLDAARAAGKGVIIAHTHSLLGELFWTWLDHAGIERGITLGEWAFSKTKEEALDAKTRAVETAREMRACVESLRAGGLVHAFADGQTGDAKIDVPMLKRLRPYRVGWAMMAAAAKCPVLTAAVSLGQGGKVSISIGAPLATEAAELTDKQRVDALVRAFAKRHEKLWLERPANITWYHMKQHLEFPKA